MATRNDSLPAPESTTPRGRAAVAVVGDLPGGRAGAGDRTGPPKRATLAVRRAAWAIPVLIVAVAYAVPLVIVPPTLPIPLIDDWNYLISVRRLVEDGELWVAPWTAATLVLQIGWGALFAAPFGVDPVPLRVSTLVASFGGSLACLALFRELGATWARAVAGALAFWLNPLVFVLSYTFMTDVPYVALLCAALYATVRAARRADPTWLAVASAVAGLAFLVRQQGALIPLATVGWLLLAQPAWYRAARARAIESTLGPCLIAVAGYLIWAARTGVPSAQGDYLESLAEAGPLGMLDLLWRLTTVGVFYAGLFVLPLILGAAVAAPAAWRRTGPVARWAAAVGSAALIAWTAWYSTIHGDRTFPFVPWGSVLHEDGLGVLDADGLRPFFFGRWVYVTMALTFAAAAIAAFLLIAGRSRDDVDDPTAHATAPHARDRFWPSLGGLLAAVGVGQFAGVVPPSLHIREVITFDRYYLPLLPIALGLTLWALRGRALSPLPIAAALALYATVGTLGVQDWFAFKQAQWDTAAWLVEEREVPLRRVDGAVQWDGTHFYERHLANPYDTVRRQAGDPWWLWIVAPMIDPVYVVAAWPNTRPGYYVWTTRPYESWIRANEDEQIYVWRRYPTRPTSRPQWPGQPG